MSTATRTIADWLLDCIAEDEAVAQSVIEARDRDHERWRAFHAERLAAHPEWYPDAQMPDWAEEREEDWWHDDEYDRLCANPAHALAVCAAHRKIVDEALSRLRDAEMEPECEGVQWAGTVSGDFLRALALAYADRPGFQESWRS